MAATAVLDALMPHLANEELTEGLAAELVAEAPRAVRSSLENAGTSREEALEAGRRLSAEVARWMPGGRGLYVHRKRWARK